MKYKVIYIFSSPPAYELYYNQPRPKINWDTSDGNWVGIWGYDWGDQLGNAVLRANKNIEFEVWQVDFRADKIYSHKFENGLVHKLFPAYKKKENFTEYYHSDLLLSELSILSKSNNVLLHLGANGLFNWKIAIQFSQLPIIGTWHGKINLPLDNVFKLRKNIFSYASYFKMHQLIKKAIKNYDAITYQSDHNIQKFSNYYHGEKHKITMGIDSLKFKKMDKNLCRQELGLEKDKKIILSVSRLDTNKQVDKIIEVLNKLNNNTNDFLFIIVGNGDKEYEEYLKKIAKHLIELGKIKFLGFIRGEKLTKLYNAADLFIMCSRSEAAPVSSMEALACGVPIMSTDTGNVAEFLKEQHSEFIVPSTNYAVWKEKIEDFLNGKTPKVIDTDLVKKRYDWYYIGKKFDSLYKSIIT